VRRQAFLASGAYDGDSLFENLELMRTIRAAGGTVVTPLDLYVARRPPTAAHFASQRVRQAYDDFALPARLAAFLGVLPLAAPAIGRGRGRRLAAAALATVAVAEVGRRRGAGAKRFPFTASLLAPAWVAERSLCAWLAVAARLRGGVRYGDRRLRKSATPMRQLRRRYWASPPPLGSSARAPLSARKPIAL
jgi:hypothetical protein